MSTDDLIAKLRAALDEDERIARAATPGPWAVDNETYAETIYGEGDNYTTVVAGGRWGGEASVFDSTEDAIHIARHDPARVLRQTAAIRKLLDEHERLVEANSSDRADLAERAALWRVIRLFAEAYRIQP